MYNKGLMVRPLSWNHDLAYTQLKNSMKNVRVTQEDLTHEYFPGLDVSVGPLGKVLGHHGALQVPRLLLVRRHGVLVLHYI